MMSHAPRFWADKLNGLARLDFWFWVNEWRMSGESAYFMVLQGERLQVRA